MAELSDDALAEYMSSRGQSANIALQEEGRTARSVHSESADPTRDYDGYTPAERQYFEHGDASAVQAEEFARSPEGRRHVAQEEQRESWVEYQALQERLKQTERERNEYATANARMDEKLRLFNEALADSPDPELVALENQRQQAEVAARQDPWSNPGIALRQMREELNAVHTQRAVEKNHQVYQQAALMHEMHHPGYVREIYPAYQQSIRQSLAAAHPGWTQQQVEIAALQDEDAVFKSALAQGRDPHDMIHAQARLRGIYSTHERNQVAELDRQARAKAAREAEERQRKAHQIERDRVRVALYETPRNELLWNREHRQLRELAKKHGIPF